MGKVKRDWHQLKLEYMQGDVEEVKAFLSGKGVHYTSGMVSKVTKGWRTEKQAYKEKILKEALKEHAKKEAKSMEIPIKYLKEAKKLAVKRVVDKLKLEDSQGGSSLDMTDLDKGIVILRRELQEPTSYTKNDTVNRRPEEDLEEEDMEILQDLINEKKNAKRGTDGENEE